MEKLVKEGNQFVAGPTECKMSEGDRSVTLDAVKNYLSLWGGRQGFHARNADASLVASVASDLAARQDVEPPSRSNHTPNIQTARAPRGPAAEYVESSSPGDDLLTRLGKLRSPVWGTKTQLWRHILEISD